MQVITNPSGTTIKVVFDRYILRYSTKNISNKLLVRFKIHKGSSLMLNGVVRGWLCMVIL